MSRTLVAFAVAIGLLLAGVGAVAVVSDDSDDPTADPATTTERPTTTTAPEKRRRPRPTTTTTTPPPPPDPSEAFAGFGAWVDVFDFSPRYMEQGEKTPVVTPRAVDVMARHGVRALYIQGTRDDPRTPGLLESPRALAAVVKRAHRHDMTVVGWYLPKRYGKFDVTRLKAMRDFRGGGGFDAIGLDIEWRDDGRPHDVRSRRLVQLSRRLDAMTGTMPLAAIVPAPVAMDIINPAFWPGFPWKELAPHYDAWMPMTYWTFRESSSEWRDAYRYTETSVSLVRQHLDDDDVPVHPIGGIGDLATEGDYLGFMRAVGDSGSIGWSIYDYRTTAPGAWPLLEKPPS
jgi:hypothetical protein